MNLMVNESELIKKRLNYVGRQLLRWKLYHWGTWFSVIAIDLYLHWLAYCWASTASQPGLFYMVILFILVITMVVIIGVGGEIILTTGEYSQRRYELVKEYRALQKQYKDSLYSHSDL